MSSETAIKVENLSKCYYIYDHPRHRLKQFILPRIQRLIGHAPRNYYHEFWALNDVSLEVRKGEIFGIIGTNGSGKSTLLQIICDTLNPTSGNVQTNGRIGAILELGTGFNPEFTGRENVYLNAAVLGLSKKEIDARYSEIAAFADIGEFIEHPVKTYSTGMYSRLAFAIQTAIDPNIIVVDEALSVGDAAFTAKCMRRMHGLVEKGTTVLLVSHDMGSIRQFCSKALWIEKGEIRMLGSAAETSASYLEYCFGGTVRDVRRIDSIPRNLSFKPEFPPFHEHMSTNGLTIMRSLGEENKGLIRWGEGGIWIEEMIVHGPAVVGEGVIKYGKTLDITLKARVDLDVELSNYGFGLAFRTPKGIDAVTSTTIEAGLLLPRVVVGDRIAVKFSLENIIAPGDYFLVANIERREQGMPRYFDFVENAIQLKVISDFKIYSIALPYVHHQVTIQSEKKRSFE
jgi:lipopolysaccharide transport system ATP-binding protein